MNNYRVLVFAAATLLVTFCLTPSVKAQSTSGSMTHNNEMMTHDKSMGHDGTTTMSNPTADNGGHMKADSDTTEHMKDTTEHMKSGHMMNSHMTEAEHGNMSESGSPGQMSH
jgi:hypothetical protein